MRYNPPKRQEDREPRAGDVWLMEDSSPVTGKAFLMPVIIAKAEGDTVEYLETCSEPGPGCHVIRDLAPTGLERNVCIRPAVRRADRRRMRRSLGRLSRRDLGAVVRR